MENLLELLPRSVVALVVVPFAVGVVGLALLVEPTPAARTFVFLVGVGGALVLLLGAAGMLLLLKQNQGLERRDAEE